MMRQLLSDYGSLVGILIGIYLRYNLLINTVLWKVIPPDPQHSGIYATIWLFLCNLDGDSVRWSLSVHVSL